VLGSVREVDVLSLCHLSGRNLSRRGERRLRYAHSSEQRGGPAGCAAPPGFCPYFQAIGSSVTCFIWKSRL